MAPGSSELHGENADLAARLFALERERLVERFHEAERAREWAIASVILQFGLLTGAALLFADELHLLPTSLFESDGPLVLIAAGVAGLVLLANIVSGMGALRRSGHDHTLGPHRPAEPAE